MELFGILLYFPLQMKSIQDLRHLKPRLLRTALFAVVLALGLGADAQAQQLVYQQGFDAPVNPNGDIYFNTSPVYNGVNDSLVLTGGSFVGNATTGDGIIGTSFGGLTPQSGPYFLEEQTTGGGVPSYQGTIFSTAGTTIFVLPNSTYQLSFYAGAINLVQPTIVPTINAVALGGPVSPVIGAPLQQFTFTYNSGAATNAVIALNNNTVTGGGNDFAVDSIQFTIIQATFPTLGLTPNQTAVANNLSSGNLNGVSTPVYNALVANPGSYPGILDQLSPEEFGRFASVTAFNNASFEAQAMDDYLAGLRAGTNGTFLGGNGKIDSSELTINDPNDDSALAAVHSRLLAWNPGTPDGLESDSPALLLDGVDMKDDKDMKSMGTSADSDPWNVFVRGNVTMAQGFSQIDVGHFDENTESVVLGADYRFTPNFLVGLTAGYGHTDVTLDSANSTATVDSYSPGLYASYANGGWYANLVGDYIHNAYTQNRVIPFLGQTANSAPEGNEGLADLDGGYDFHKGALTFGPVAGVEYTHLTVDGYSETGSVADLQVKEQDADSLRSRLGGRISYAYRCHGITLTPHLSATWQHEFMDQGRGITSQFDSTSLGSFTVRTENPQRDFALADAGITADLNRRVSLFAEYMVQAGQDNYFGQSVQAGVKIGF
jgi:outer membrane autotransporter protein